MNSIYIALLLILTTSTVHAEVVSKSYWGDKAIGSHDTVQYHNATVRKQHKEVKGVKTFAVLYSGANWYFASKASADKFAAEPDKYKPRYNGFCANALSIGEGLVNTNGKVWEFFDDELHLFYAEAGRKRWLEGDWKRYQKDANSAWQKLKNG